MSTPKRTPEPWRVSESGLNVVTAEADANAGYPHGRAVAQTCNHLPLPERQRIARLLAAAPNYFAAAEKIAASVEDTRAVVGDEAFAPGFGVMVPWLLIRELLAAHAAAKEPTR